MKKLFVTLLLPVMVNAHSHQPQEVKEYVVQPVNKYQIDLINMYKTNVCYKIYIDASLTDIQLIVDVLNKL